MNFILWAEETCGFYKAIKDAPREQYDEAVASGVLRIRRNDYDGEMYDEHPLVFIAFLTVEDDHDFKLGATRGYALQGSDPE